MRPLVRVVYDADDTPAAIRDLGRLHDPAGGVVVVRPTPGRGDAGIARDILRALGKRFDIAGTPRSATRLLEPTRLWLAAEQTRCLIITRAHLLATADWTTLLALTKSDSTLNELWLVIHEPALRPQHRAALRRVRFDEIAQLPTHPRAPRPRPRPTADEKPHPPVPRADFLAFFARCAELLDRDDLQRVADTYRQGQRATENWLKRRQRTSAAELRAFIGHLIEGDSNIDSALSILRGAQARLFVAGLLLHIDADRFTAWHDETPRIHLSAPVSALLRAFTSTQHAALAALAALTRWPPERLATINIADLDADASELRGGHPVPDHAQALVRAQQIARAAQGAMHDAPLFTAHNGVSRASTQLLTAHLDGVAARTGLQFVSGKGMLMPTDDIALWANVTALTDVRR